MRRLAFLLHIYQPPTQHEDVLRSIADSCYLPLIKLIKNKKVNITLNVPLSLLEQMDKYGYKEWLQDLKTLVDSERVELVGSGAYHPLLSKIPVDFAEKQVILNEYALGYYFGKKGGFEGDPSIMIRNLAGFFPPELAVNMDVLNLVNDLGYEWMLVDESSIPNDMGEIKHGIYEVGDLNTRVVARNLKLSDMIEGKRDLNVGEIVETAFQSKNSVASFDGEAFGHHYDQGITFFEKLLSGLKKKGVEVVTVSEYAKTKNEKELQNIVESTWNTSQEETDSGELYPRWDATGNALHKIQWEILNKVLKTYKPNETNPNMLGMEEIPIWLPDELLKIEDEELRNSIELDLLIAKAIQSDQFWWDSFGSIQAPGMIANADVLWAQVIEKMGDKKAITYVTTRLEKLKKAIEKANPDITSSII